MAHPRVAVDLLLERGAGGDLGALAVEDGDRLVVRVLALLDRSHTHASCTFSAAGRGDRSLTHAAGSEH